MSDEKTIHDAPMDDAGMLDEYGHLEGWLPRMHRFRRATGTVLLDPDVAAVFQSSEAVNRGLRILIAEGRVPKDPSDE